MIKRRRLRIELVSSTPLCADLRTRCYPLVWFAYSVNGAEPLHVVAYREPDGRLSLLVPPWPLNSELPEWIERQVTTKVRRHIRRMARGEA